MGCCAGGIRIIQVGGESVGLSGLDRILAQKFLEGWAPSEQGLAEALLAAVRTVGNHIVLSREAVYREALLEVFTNFYNSKQQAGRDLGAHGKAS